MHDYPLLRSLDPHHSRLGYLAALSTVSMRNLDTNDALVSRFKDLLFERLYSNESRFDQLMGEIEPGLEEELRKRMERSTEDDPSSILSPPGRDAGWLTVSEFWLYDRRLPSHVGYLQEKHASRTVDFARAVGVILPTLDLSEMGFLLQILAADSMSTTGNPLDVRTRPALTLLLLRLLFSAEILLPFILVEFSERINASAPINTRGESGLLRGAVRRLVEAAGEPSDPEDVLAVRELHDFEFAILKSRSTEENYLRPRIEMLVDLGILTRKRGDTSEKPGAFPWNLPNVTVQLVARLDEIIRSPLTLDSFLEENFNAAFAPAIGLELSPPKDEIEVVRWFYRAYEIVQREIGFTPGRSVAVLATLLAAEHGTHLEVRPLFDFVYALPSSRFGTYISFSGGSRFDSEFMIKIAPGIVELLGEVPAETPRKES